MRNIRCEVCGGFAGAGQEVGQGREEGPACAVKTINTWMRIRHKEKVPVGVSVRKWPEVWARDTGEERKERALAWYGSGCLPLRS